MGFDSFPRNDGWVYRLLRLLGRLFGYKPEGPQPPYRPPPAAPRPKTPPETP